MAPQGIPQYQPQGRWATHADPFAIRSALETLSLRLSLTGTPCQAEEDDECVEEKEGHETDIYPQSLDSVLDAEEEGGGVDEEEDIEKVCSVEM